MGNKNTLNNHTHSPTHVHILVQVSQYRTFSVAELLYWGECEQVPPSGVAGRKCMYILYACCKSVAALILHILSSCTNSKMIHNPQQRDHA